jgi:predicted dehydrogenase
MRLCLVGCGIIADRHAIAIRIANADVLAQASPGTDEPIKVVATVDPRAEAAERLAGHFGDHGAAAFDSLEAALASLGSEIDAVLLMVPPGLNPKLVAVAMHAKKHCLAQKPIAPTPQAAHQLLAEAKTLGAGQPGSPLLMISEHAHWQAEVRLVQQQIQDGAIGSVISVRANFYGGTGGFEAGTWRSQIEGDGGIVVDGGTHYVRPLRYALRARYPAATAASHKLVRRALTRTGCARSGCGWGR